MSSKFMVSCGPVFKVEFNGAARFTDYSTSVELKWKVASPTHWDITLRVTQSRDIRAPNMSELYDAGRARTIRYRLMDFLLILPRI